MNILFFLYNSLANIFFRCYDMHNKSERKKGENKNEKNEEDFG